MVWFLVRDKNTTGGLCLAKFTKAGTGAILSIDHDYCIDVDQNQNHHPGLYLVAVAPDTDVNVSRVDYSSTNPPVNSGPGKDDPYTPIIVDLIPTKQPSTTGPWEKSSAPWGKGGEPWAKDSAI